MKTYWFAALLAVLAAGCAPEPYGTESPGNTSDSNVSISTSSDQDSADDTTLVSLNIPGMT